MRWLCLFILIPWTAQAADIAVCDPNDPDVPDRVVKWIPSANTTDWLSVPNILIHPDTSGLSESKPRYWKCSGGGLVDMTAAEKTALDADFVAAQQQFEADLAELLSIIQQGKPIYQRWSTAGALQKDGYSKEMGRAIWLIARMLMNFQVSDDPNAP